MSNLFLTTPMSACTPYGILVLGFLTVAIMVLCILGADSYRQYEYSDDHPSRRNAVYCYLAAVICLCAALFILFRRTWLMMLAFMIVIGLTFLTVGGGIRNQAERE